MEFDFSKRKHESPFDDALPPKESPFADDLPQAESPVKVKTPTISQPKTSSVHGSSEKAQFRVFIGAFFLLAAFPAGYWANYTFREYRNNAAVLQSWREHPEEIRTTLKPADEIYIQSTRVQNKMLEASLFGAGSLLCLLIAAYLFFRAVRISRRTKNVKYEEIDWHSFNKPSAPIEVLYGRIHSIAAILFYIFFGGLTLLAILGNLKGGITLPMIVIGLTNSALLAVVYYLQTNGKRKSIKLIDAGGITRGDGKHFLWSDFRGTIQRIGRNRYGGSYIWRTELIFANNGVVWVIPQRIKNYDEVYGLVDLLPAAVLKST